MGSVVSYKLSLSKSLLQKAFNAKIAKKFRKGRKGNAIP
jgi:hypothetical protein